MIETLFSFGSLTMSFVAVLFARAGFLQTLPKIRSCKIHRTPTAPDDLYCRLVIEPGSSPACLKSLSVENHLITPAIICNEGSGGIFLSRGEPSSSIPLDLFISSSTGRRRIDFFVRNVHSDCLYLSVSFKDTRHRITFEADITKATNWTPKPKTTTPSTM